MTRLPRIVLPGQPQLILQRGNGAEPIFRRECDYRFYLDSLDSAAQRYGGDVHAYVLMGDYVHLLITPHAEDSIARILQQVGRAFVRYLHHTYQCSGGLWDGRYKAAIVESERYLLACYRYIELAPVRDRQIVHPDDYPWSSSRAHVVGDADPWLCDHLQYQALGPTPGARREAYRALLNTPLDESSMAAIQSAMVSGWALGSEGFKTELIALLERRSATYALGARRRVRELVGDE